VAHIEWQDDGTVTGLACDRWSPNRPMAESGRLGGRIPAPILVENMAISSFRPQAILGDCPMSWWNKLLGHAPEERTSKMSFPARIELDSAKLTAQVYLHEIETADESLSCWSYVTDGLLAHQQKEVVFTLRRVPDEPDDKFPQEPLHLFRTIYQLAQKGQLVDVGGFTQFGARSLFGRHLAYVSPQPLRGVVIPQRAISALLVTEDELLAVREFGITRVMSRLGQASRFYPCPSWSDRSRPGLSFGATRQPSVLTTVRRVRAPGVQVSREGEQIRVRLFRHTQPRWEELFAQTATDAPLALLTDLDPTANACLVWETGQTGPAAITPPGSDGSCVSGCFAVFVPQQAADRGQVVEDGFAMLLTTSSWTAIRQALTQGQAIVVPAKSDGLSISVEWLDEAYHNPVDGRTYEASGGWQTYKPESPRVGDQGRVKVRADGVRLLTTQEEIVARTAVEDLASFCKGVEHLADQVLGKTDKGFKLLVQFKCVRSGHESQLAHQGDVSEVLLQEFYDALKAMNKLTVRRGEVSFQVGLTVEPRLTE
jgi:hypothetical protein